VLDLVLDSIFFSFNKIVKQIFGTPMNSPFFPILADIVLQDIEEVVLNCINLPFVFRYVDDILFAVSRNCLEEIENIFNSFREKL